jgi:hypothetical protein
MKKLSTYDNMTNISRLLSIINRFGGLVLGTSKEFDVVYADFISILGDKFTMYYKGIVDKIIDCKTSYEIMDLSNLITCFQRFLNAFDYYNNACINLANVLVDKLLSSHNVEKRNIIVHIIDGLRPVNIIDGLPVHGTSEDYNKVCVRIVSILVHQLSGCYEVNDVGMIHEIIVSYHSILDTSEDYRSLCIQAVNILGKKLSYCLNTEYDEIAVLSKLINLFQPILGTSEDYNKVCVDSMSILIGMLDK